MRAFVILLVAAMLVACTGPPRPRVQLAPPVKARSDQTADENRATPSPVPLRIAVASLLSPRETFRRYRQLVGYVGNRVGGPIRFVERLTYSEINALVRAGQVDLAFVSTLPYVEGQREFGMELLAAPVVRGRTEYHAYLIVPADSAAG